jgi:ABC-type polysaccharide/polyol phosphate export permease
MFPLWLVSGLIWSLEALPNAIRFLSYLSPLSFPVESLRSIMLRGWSLNNFLNVLNGYVVSIGYALICSVINFVIFEKFSTSAVSTEFLNKFLNK